ncbi:hypothetical protein DFH07DRAFT_1066376 [Mycena maculata]|uniref:Uncharacterized protein n=1 Tax=Mycena maculata TaxID=230809 RepID=A0AAD7HUC7_9AGAR|nr:hypothetical protein DFH07DRAFT_1066376 [Mycena maculata]
MSFAGCGEDGPPPGYILGCGPSSAFGYAVFAMAGGLRLLLWTPQAPADLTSAYFLAALSVFYAAAAAILDGDEGVFAWITSLMIAGGARSLIYLRTFPRITD